MIARQAGALVWLRATLWRRRIFQQRQWGRLAISLLGIGMGAALSGATALLLVRFGEQLRTRPDLVAQQGGSLALFATWLTSALFVRLWFAFVPRGQARIRTQMSAAHEREHLDTAIAAFAKVGRELGVI